MKLTFEGKTFGEIFDQMQELLKATMAEHRAQKAQGPGPEIPHVAVKPVDRPVDKPARTEKQLANDERLKAAALAKKAAGTMFKKAAVPEPEPVKKLAEKMVEELAEDLRPDPFVQQPEIDPAELVKVRQKTIADLQTAYANGHHKEVLVLLSRYGNGAKSFRELPPEAFQPIRAAIDNGALE